MSARYAAAGPRWSRTLTPMKVTPWALVAASTFSSSGASERQGGQYEAQKFTTTTWPRCWASSKRPPPSMRSPPIAGALARWSTAILRLPRAFWGVALPQPPAARTAARATRIRTRRISGALGVARRGGERDEVGGWLGVRDPDDLGVLEVEAGEAG